MGRRSGILEFHLALAEKVIGAPPCLEVLPGL
jgi:hypothetical protein